VTWVIDPAVTDVTPLSAVALSQAGDLVSDVGRLRPGRGNAGSQAAAARRTEVRDANTTVELR
jgi:hypothetical protein